METTKTHPGDLSLRLAKMACRSTHGRLPRCGYEMRVSQGVWNGQRYETFLANEGGRYRVWTWREPMTNDWYERHYPSEVRRSDRFRAMQAA